MKIETQDRVPNDMYHFKDLEGQEDTRLIGRRKYIKIRAAINETERSHDQ